MTCHISGSLTLSFAFILFTNVAFAQVEPDTIRQEAWKQFEAEHGIDWQVQWNEKSGTPRAVTAGLTEPYPGSAVQAARAFLNDHRRLFGMEAGLPNLELASERRLRKVHHVRFQQTYRGLSVYEADYLVHLRDDGRVTMANGTYYPDIEAPTTPQVDRQAAWRIAINDLTTDVGAENVNKGADSELIIYPQDGQFHLAWKLTVLLDTRGGWDYFIDALDGSILQKESLLMDAATGDGNVYTEHPNTSSVTTRTLRRLDGSGYLRGTYANVVNDENNTSRAQESDLSFQYSTSNTHFDEVNLYYHIDNFRNNYVEELGDGSPALSFTRIKAHAHATHPVFGDGNAWFDRTNQELYFGDGSSTSGANNFAREDKVIYHEYGHAVIYDQNSAITSDCQEEGAISEGVPDYFAGAFSGRTKILDYAYPSGERDMAFPEYITYSDYNDAEGTFEGPPCNGSGVESHVGGEFFSAVLWDLREKLLNYSEYSTDQADWLVYAALSYVSSDPTFSEFRSAMVSEAQAEYGSGLGCLVKATFHDRGIGSDCLPPPPPPSNFRIANSSSVGDRVLLRWSGHPDANSYEIYRDKGSGFQQIASPSGTQYTDYGTRIGGGQSCNGNAVYYAKAVNSNGTSGPSSYAWTCTQNRLAVTQVQRGVALPDTFALEGNAPNPVGTQTTLRYALPEAAEVQITVYDVMGRKVARLADGLHPAGFHEVQLDASALPSGVYFYRMQAGEAFIDTGRMVIVR